MSQTQLKQSYVGVTITCNHCRKEQVVLVRPGGGLWSAAHQSVLCLSCAKYFYVMLPEAIIGGPFLR
jgi:ribosomal protein S27E